MVSKIQTGLQYLQSVLVTKVMAVDLAVVCRVTLIKNVVDMVFATKTNVIVEMALLDRRVQNVHVIRLTALAMGSVLLVLVCVLVAGHLLTWMEDVISGSALTNLVLVMAPASKAVVIALRVGLVKFAWILYVLANPPATIMVYVEHQAIFESNQVSVIVRVLGTGKHAKGRSVIETLLTIRSAMDNMACAIPISINVNVLLDGVDQHVPQNCVQTAVIQTKDGALV